MYFFSVFMNFRMVVFFFITPSQPSCVENKKKKNLFKILIVKLDYGLISSGVLVSRPTKNRIVNISKRPCGRIYFFYYYTFKWPYTNIGSRRSKSYKSKTASGYITTVMFVEFANVKIRKALCEPIGFGVKIKKYIYIWLGRREAAFISFRAYNFVNVLKEPRPMTNTRSRP